MNELTITLLEIKPHIICISEHHLNSPYLNLSHIPSYRLGANYCRTTQKCGGTCIFVHEDVHFSNINLGEHCMEKDLEISALKVTFKKKSFIILCLYRAPSGDLYYFLHHLEEILLSLYNPKIQFILCGDFNTDLSRPNHPQTQLINLFNMFNLKGTVSFYTRITSTSSTMIDNIFVDKNSSYLISPWINGLSDHDAQILRLEVHGGLTSQPSFIYIRDLNEHNIASFLHCLSYEQWSEVFEENDINKMFNNFLNVYMRCHQSNFPIIKRYPLGGRRIVKTTQLIRKKVFILICINYMFRPTVAIIRLTKGIVISCLRKKELFILSKTLNDQ